MTRIKEIEENINEGEVKAEKIGYLGRWIEKLAGRECEIQSEGYEKEGQNYFKVMLPIFMEKYQYDSYYGRERGGNERDCHCGG